MFKFGKFQPKPEIEEIKKEETPQQDPQQDYHGILFHTSFVPEVGINGALFLSQAWYWHDKPSRSPHRGWFWHSDREWRNETQLTEHELRKAKKIAKKSGLIRWKRKGCTPKTYYRLDYDRILKLLALENQESPRKIKGPARKAESAHPDGRKAPNLPKTTGKDYWGKDDDRLAANSTTSQVPEKTAMVEPQYRSKIQHANRSPLNTGSSTVPQPPNSARPPCKPVRRPFTEDEFYEHTDFMESEDEPRFRNHKCRDDFLEFNEKRGWRMNGKPMRDWKKVYENWVYLWKDWDKLTRKRGSKDKFLGHLIYE